jgi:hypothetical protein
VPSTGDRELPIAGPLLTQEGSWRLVPKEELRWEIEYAPAKQSAIADFAVGLDGALELGIPWGSILVGPTPLAAA